MNKRQVVWAYVFVVTLGIIFLLPLIWVLLISIKRETEYLAYPIKLLPAVPQWSNYVTALTKVAFFRFLKNTVYLATLYTVLAVTSSALVGYGFARHNAPGKNIIFTLLISMLILPRMVTLIPQFVLFSRIGLVGNELPWILWGLTGSAWNIFMFRQFFAAFPKELEDAAEVDGCSRFRIFWQIFLPNSYPVLATSMIFHFQSVWGSVLNPLLFLPERLATLAMKLAGSLYRDPRGNYIATLTMAGVVLYTIPVILLFLAAQRYIVEGVVTTGIKG